MKQQKKIAVASSSTELAISTQALALKGEINALHRETLKAGNEMMKNAVRCGQLLGQVKLILKASKTATFENWVEQNLDVSYRSARSYMLLSNRLEELQNWQSSAILQTADSISEAFRLIETTRPTVSKTETVDEPIPTSPPPASHPEIEDFEAEDTGGGGESDLTGEWVDEPPAPEEKPKPIKNGAEKVSAAKLVDNAILTLCSPLARALLAIAKANGGKGPEYEAATEHLNCVIGCLKDMRKGTK
jgi:hypothetical protein